MKMNNTNIINKIKNELCSILFNYFGDKIYSIILYGSYARGDNTKDSDMDIMVLFNCSKNEVMKYRKDISYIASDISLENDIMVSIIIRDLNSFNENQNRLPFYQNIVKEGIPLYGTI